MDFARKEPKGTRKLPKGWSTLKISATRKLGSKRATE